MIYMSVILNYPIVRTDVPSSDNRSHLNSAIAASTSGRHKDTLLEPYHALLSDLLEGLCFDHIKR
jgi:hypothetical protein